MKRRAVLLAVLALSGCSTGTVAQTSG
ncbi:MAG: hypothetical protein V7603_4984, partial [Micromonosporaceae bacterium]